MSAPASEPTFVSFTVHPYATTMPGLDALEAAPPPPPPWPEDGFPPPPPLAHFGEPSLPPAIRCADLFEPVAPLHYAKPLEPQPALPAPACLLGFTPGYTPGLTEGLVCALALGVTLIVASVFLYRGGVRNSPQTQAFCEL